MTRPAKPNRGRMDAAFRREVRQAFADYYASEGCTCCRNVEAHAESLSRLAKLLRIPKFSDGSGYDVYRFQAASASDREAR